MSKPILDEADKQLLAALKRNSRASLVSLARSIGLSRSATHDRIVRLEESGIIKGYTINVDRVAQPAIKAFLTLRFAPGVSDSSLIETIRKIEGVEVAYCLAGDIDMLVYCEADTSEALGATRDRIALLDGVLEISTRQVLSSSGA
ncbi:MAG: Lrp/AsnC family transcriptional regulator [Pseudomonadota bacterium]